MKILQEFMYNNIESNRKSLLFIDSLNEAESFQVSDKLVTELYKTAMEKYQYIDFGDIPESKGDITKLKDYDTINKSIMLLEDLKNRSGIQKIQELDTIKASFNYLAEYQKQFTLGFLQQKNIIIVTYNTMVTSIICGINLIIASMIEFIRTPNGEFEVVFNRQKENNSMEYLLMDNLTKFNVIVEKGELTKFFNTALSKENFAGVALTGAVAAGVTVGLIAFVPVMRELIYYIYNIRMKISEYLKIQAQFIQLNANSLKFNNDAKTQASKKSVISNQEKNAKVLEDLSSKFRVKYENAQTTTKKDLNQRFTTDSVQSSMSSVDPESTRLSLI